MTIHYHGTPITPRAELLKLSGRHFCVSYAKPQDLRACLLIAQSVMLDNGAFSVWRRGIEPDWEGYYNWCEKHLGPSVWAVVPDSIEGGEVENNRLLEQWPFPPAYSAPVWHMCEPLARLGWLCREWSRVCIGSSAEYAQIGTPRWHDRMTRAWNHIAPHGLPPVDIHMLRGMSLTLAGNPYPFASVDSTDIARNHNRDQNSVTAMADYWDAQQCPARWEEQPEQMELCG